MGHRLTTERLVLEVPGASDAGRLVRYASDNREHLEPWEPERPAGYFTEAAFLRQIEATLLDVAAGRCLAWMLLDRSAPEGPVLGRVSLTNVVHGPLQAGNLGYSLDHRKVGGGWMSEALEAVIRHCFEALGLHRLMANYMPNNERSGALLRRLGFTAEGYARDYLKLGGRWQDHVLTSLTREDWRLTRPPRLVDLSHGIRDGLITYPGLPAPVVCDFLSRESSRSRYAPGTEFQIGRIEMVSNTGTYLDCPFHRYADGKDTSQVGLAALADLPGLVIRARERAGRAIDVDCFEGRPLRGRAVLVDTGWSERWGRSDYFEGHPHLTEAAALCLRDAGARLVGIDSMNIDCTDTGERPVHSVLLAAEILIAEHLRGLDGLPDEGFEFSAVPPKFEGVGTFPVRAFARVR